MKRYFIQGLGNSFPIVLGYFPVAVAFGLAAKSAGFSPFFTTLISIFVFAGASQFALVGMISGGTSLISAFVICLALNARHALYGPTLSTKLDKSKISKRMIYTASFGLTDEVFSTSISRIENISPENQMIWLMGVETGAYSAWVFGTILGAFGGDAVTTYLPSFESTLSFSFSALFLTLLVLMMKKDNIIPVLAAVFVAVVSIYLNIVAIGIIVAAIIGPLTWLFLEKNNDNN